MMSLWKLLGAACREIIGLFVDDGALALQIIAVVILAAIAIHFAPGAPMAAGAILLVGSLGALVFNVTKFGNR